MSSIRTVLLRIAGKHKRGGKVGRDSADRPAGILYASMSIAPGPEPGQITIYADGEPIQTIKEEDL